jgi:hypothetical protein
VAGVKGKSGKRPHQRGVLKIPRVCLKCDRAFMAAGKYNRLCPKCQEANLRLSVIAQGWGGATRPSEVQGFGQAMPDRNPRRRRLAMIKKLAGGGE